GATGATNGANEFAANVDAGVALELNGNSVGTFEMTQTTIRNTLNGPLTNFNGSGFAVRMLGTSTLDVAIDGDVTTPPTLGPAGAPAGSTVLMTGNSGDGANIYVDGSSLLNSMVIVNSIFSANLDDGVEVMREGSGMVDNVLMVNNDMSFNAGDGIFLNARNALSVDDYLILQNRIGSNVGNGIYMLAEADAQILADIAFNQITSNLGSGILAEDRKNHPTDQSAVAGDWIGNTITGNSAYGVNLLAVHGTFDDLNIGLDGVDGIGRSRGNTISTNARDGIQIGGNDQTALAGTAGFVSILNNTISSNGTANIDNDNNGIDINTPALLQSAIINNNTITGNFGNGMELSARGELVGANTTFLVVSADNNTITGNSGDGIEILTSGNNSGTTGRQRTDIEITNSNISLNNGRGIEILNRGDGDTFHRTNITIGGTTTFDLNMREAVYIVNTADLDQALDSNGPADLTAGGNVLNNPILEFTMTGATVSNNGNSSTLPGSGLLIYVGTSGATTSATDTGGFVSNGVGGLTGRGGVLGTITSNSFSGNFGVDVLFESFTSTVDPSTGTTWDAMAFNAAGYQSDPLARFDVTFTGNTGDAADVTRFGAFYDNADAVFKSRDTAQTPAGPFDVGGARLRNAQRLASRTAPFNDPLVSPDMGTFLYPGVGSSTFRASAGSTTAGFSISDGFGSTVPLGILTGELPFTWGSF
ncbi:MAG: right-handed parallel beta-helix repeat-containing protein, partial [Planctomycetaceae bacterium]|nr:right-handed parallel beta-helix repeat-containing protein [Planctomycetaceae bacterium]